MKLLLVSPQQKMANGGIAVWTNMFLEAVADTDIEPYVLNIAMVGRRLENGSAKRSIFDEIKRTRRIFRDLRALLRENTYDVAHINTSCGKFGIARDYMTARKIKRAQPNTKIILHCNCDIPVQIRGKRAFKYLRRLVEMSDIVLVLCESSAEYVKRHFNVKGIKIPNFIDRKYIRDDKREINETLKNVLFVGRVGERKGAPELIEVAKARPELNFRLAGAVSDSIRALDIPDNVTLLGPLPHSEVIAEMDRADVFLFPTHSEGFSIALLESMARGLPAVATDVGANADMLSHGCGVIIPPRDNVGPILAALDRIRERGAREEMSRLCVARVRELYTTDRVISEMRKCYTLCEEDGK